MSETTCPFCNGLVRETYRPMQVASGNRRQSRCRTCGASWPIRDGEAAAYAAEVLRLLREEQRYIAETERALGIRQPIAARLEIPLTLLERVLAEWPEPGEREKSKTSTE